jgi:predicted phage tail protein
MNASAAMTEIKLLSTLGKRYGRTHRVQLSTKTPSEAIRWLTVNFPGAKQYFAQAHTKGITFAIFRGRGAARENIGLEQLSEPAGDCITIAPVTMGAKAGVLQTVIGIILIAADVIFFHTGYLTTLGVSLVAGGIVQMLSPQTKVNKNADSSGNQASYVFSGPVNTTAQGNPVPVLYGRMIVGSAVISAGMEADDYSPATNGVGSGVPGGSSLKTPYDTLPA